jgi:hypothetical protein
VSQFTIWLVALCEKLGDEHGSARNLTADMERPVMITMKMERSGVALDFGPDGDWGLVNSGYLPHTVVGEHSGVRPLRAAAFSRRNAGRNPISGLPSS